MTPIRCWILRLSLAALAVAPVGASGLDAPHYLVLRAKSHYNRKLAYADLQADPAAYIGQAVELRGSVSGSADSGDGAFIILTLADGNAVDLPVSASEMALIQQYSNPSLRVLARIAANPTGNAPVFEVLAIAGDGEVGLQEAARAAQREAQRRQDEAREREEARRLLAGGTRRGGFVSRHAPSRSMPLAPALSGGAYDSYAQYLGPRARPLFPAYRNYIAAQNPRLTTQQTAQIAANLLHFADNYNVDPRLIVAMIMAESHFNPQATSRTGAMGLGQLMPGTARSLGVNNAYDPAENLQGCIGYLRSRLDTFADRSLPGGGVTFEQVRLAMAAYNAGEGAVRKYGGVPPYRETQAYVQRVERLYRQLIGQ